MSNMPAFQFYPSDWQANPNLRRCTHEEKGVWIDIMCLLHDSDEYGVLRWPLDEIATAIGSTAKKLRGLVTKGVLKGVDKGACEAFVYTPRSGGKDGDPVTLIEEQDGPIWYSSRMVKDAYVRKRRGASTRFEGSPDKPPKDKPKSQPKPPIGDDIGTHKGHGPSSSSSSSSSDSTPLPPEPTDGLGASAVVWRDERMPLILAKVPNLDPTSAGIQNFAPLRKLEAEGLDFDQDILPALIAVGQSWNNPKRLIYSWGLPSIADMAHANHARRQSGLSTVTADEWARRLANWRHDRTWHKSWGPNPEEPGYIGPKAAAA